VFSGNHKKNTKNWAKDNNIEEYKKVFKKIKRKRYKGIPFIMTNEEIKDLDTDEKINKHNLDFQNKHKNKPRVKYLIYKKNQCLYHGNNLRSNRLVCSECEDRIIITIKNVEEIYNVLSPWIIFGAIREKNRQRGI
jgi:hypothetical protein